MPKASPANSPITQITASLAANEGLLNVLQIVDSFVTHPFDPNVAINRDSVTAFLAQLTPRLPSNLKERILRLADITADPVEQRLVKITELTPSSDDPHNITRFLADGGIGRVWVADDEHLGREVVLKQLLPISADNSETRARFVHEAQITGQLQHPNIVPVYSMDWDAEDAPFYTMRYIRGESFKNNIEKLHSKYNGKVRTQEFYQLLESFICICNAVSYAHSQGIVHCDLKPENVAVGQFGEITVLDWGLAHRLSLSGPPSGLPEESISGTPNYLSPEQAQGIRECLTPATDIYSLGAILFEILFNRPPRQVDDQPTSLQSLLNAVIKGDIPHAVDVAPRNARVIANICDKCLATLPADRYASVQDLIDDLYRWRDDQRVHVAPNPITKQVARIVRRHHRTTVAALFLLIVATIVTTGFYTAVTSSQYILEQARDRERKQQTNIDQQQIALTTAIADVVIARHEAEKNERNAQFQTTASDRATLEHQMARTLAIDATQRATAQQRKAAIATLEANRQSKRSNMSRLALDIIRTKTENLSYQRQLEIESGYTNTAMQLADAGDFQTALAWASVSRNHAISIDRSPDILAEHQIRIMAIRSKLPSLIGYLQFSQSPMLTSYSETASALATVSRSDSPQDTTLRLFRSGTLEKLHPAIKLGLSASAIAFSPDGKFLIIAGPHNRAPIANELMRISLSDFSLDRLEIAVANDITALAATDDQIVIGTKTGLLSTYAIETLKLQQSIEAHTDAITTLSISPQLTMAATGSMDTTARIWELESLAPLSVALRHKTPLVDVRFSNLSNTVVTTEENGFSLSWNHSLFLTKPRMTRGPSPSSKQIVSVTAHHPAELLLAIGTVAGDVRVFNAPGSDFIAPLTFGSRINTLTFSNDGRLLIMGTAAGHLSVYDFSQRQMIYNRVSHLGSITSANLSPNNQFLTVTSSTGQIQLWDLAQANLAPTQLSAGNEASFLRLNASQTSFLFVTNNSTVNEVTVDSRFSQIGSELSFESIIDQVVLSPSTANGFVITQLEAHPIITSKLKLAGPSIKFAGKLIDVTMSPTHHFALSSADRTIKVGTFQDQKLVTRVTAHKLPARFIRFNQDSSALVTFGSPREETGNRVIQTVSIAGDSIVKRVVVPFSINSVSSKPLANSNELLLTTVSGEVWTIDRDSLAYKPFHVLSHGAREMVSHSKVDLLLARDDTIAVLPSNGPAKAYPSKFQTRHTFYNSDFNWLLRANDIQFSIQSADTGHQICPAITVPNTIRDLILIADKDRPRVLIATSDGVYQYTIENTYDTNNSLNVNLSLLSGSQVNTEKQLVELSRNDVADLLTTANLTSPATHQTLTWLRRYSTAISAAQWKPWIDHLRQELSKLSDIRTSPAKLTLISELHYALLAAGNYEQVIKELLSREDGSVTATYQAVVLSAWINDLPLYNQSLRSLLKRADPRVSQDFVYLLNGLSLAPHNFPTESLIKSLDRLPDRLASNPLVQRGQLAIAIFRNDKLMASNALAKLARPGLSLPIRIYAKMAGTWIDPQSITDLELRQLNHQLKVLPALESGNPGTSWDERCLLDMLFRRLQSSHQAAVNGGSDE
jgi:serine/threonine protein kinase/WD40 repeat protein